MSTKRLIKPKKLYKSSWIETHYDQKESLRKSYTSAMVIGDSVVAGLRCYSIVLRPFFSRYKAATLGTGGDRVEKILRHITILYYQILSN